MIFILQLLGAQVSNIERMTQCEIHFATARFVDSRVAFNVSMEFVLQPLTIRITNCAAKSRMMESSAEKRKHGETAEYYIRDHLRPVELIKPTFS